MGCRGANRLLKIIAGMGNATVNDISHCTQVVVLVMLMQRVLSSLSVSYCSLPLFTPFT